MKRFCGVPKGVKAAPICEVRATKMTSFSLCFIFRDRTIGKSVIIATSILISMERKKLINSNFWGKNLDFSKKELTCKNRWLFSNPFITTNRANNKKIGTKSAWENRGKALRW